MTHPHYATSRDYDLLRTLLDDGPVLGWVDCSGSVIDRAPVQIWKRGEDSYAVSDESKTHLFMKPGRGSWCGFSAACHKYNLEFVLPTKGEGV